MSLEGVATAENILRGKINSLNTLVINAYDLAVKNGFEGTEAEWLASLMGDKGDVGVFTLDGKKTNIDMDGFKVTGLGEPTEKSDAVSLEYASTNYKPKDWMPTADDVGARPNTWLPTIADIGAAPAGFGLGGTGAEVADLDDATNNGWYWWTSGAVNVPFEYGSMIVLKRGSRTTQLAFDPFMVGHGGIVVRHNNGTSWLEWQWLNPPMNVGSEYLLAERHQNKPVYTKLIALGALPNNSSKNVDIGVNKEMIVRAEIMIGNGTNLMQLPYFMADGTLVAKHLFNATNVQITTTRDYSGYNGHVQIWYTKN